VDELVDHLEIQRKLYQKFHLLERKPHRELPKTSTPDIAWLEIDQLSSTGHPNIAETPRFCTVNGNIIRLIGTRNKFNT
jgi:hypothetical protein